MLYTTYEKYRNKKKKTDADIQKETGISQQYIFGWKEGKYEPSGKKALPIAKYLGIPIEIALKYEGKKRLSPKKWKQTKTQRHYMACKIFRNKKGKQ